MSENIVLRGITWNHSRGYVSVVATAQRYTELHPEVEIVWDKRSLQAFADAPIQALAQTYDLLVIDHPWAGVGVASGVLLPLEDYIPAAYLADQAANSVGKSHQSYTFGGKQCALAIDAATPVASYRPDLLARYGLELPQTWDDLLQLARKGYVIFPGIPVDTLMNWYMLCSTLGQDPIQADEWAVSDDIALEALERLRELSRLCPPEIFNRNPIMTYNTLSSQDDYVYCPFAYGYSNYSRRGYAQHVLAFGDMIRIHEHTDRCRTTLGGTGLAISSHCTTPQIAADYAMFTGSPVIQQTVYAENSGQPGHRSAWQDEALNARTLGCFQNSLPALDRAYLLPRYPGYMNFQHNAGDPIRNYNMHGGDVRGVLTTLKGLFDASKRAGS